jgi:DNA-binding NtrC family response regulator
MRKAGRADSTWQTMPGLTGADLSARMLRIRPDLPIILCTGYSSIITQEEARSIGIRSPADKPMGKKEIARLIRQVLSGESAH